MLQNNEPYKEVTEKTLIAKLNIVLPEPIKATKVKSNTVSKSEVAFDSTWP